MRSSVFFLIFIALAAGAEPIADAQRLLSDARFEEARQTASKLLQGKASTTPRQTAELHFLIAQASASLGDVAEAERSFARALELVPALQLPIGTSPKLTGPYEAARRMLEGRSLAVTPSGSRVGDRAVIVVKVAGDVMHLFARGIVSSAAADVPLAPTDPPQASLECPPGRCTYRLTLLDVAGNPLLEAGTEAAPLILPEALSQPSAPISSAEPVSVAIQPDEPWFQRPLPYFLIAGVSAAGAGVLGWQTDGAERRTRSFLAVPAEHTYAELQRQAGARDGFFAGTIALAALAVSAAVIGVIVW